MTEQAPPRPLHPVVKVLAGILVLCTLVALWTTAAQIKARKIAARYGDRIDPSPTSEAPLPEVFLKGDQGSTVGHLNLGRETADGSLLVADAQHRPVVRFRNLKIGQERGWQELRLKVLDAGPDSLTLAPEFRPGSPCFGAGDYLALRPGLRIEFPGGHGATIVSWDASKSEARVKVGEQELIVVPGPVLSADGLHFSIISQGLRIE